MIFGLNRNSIPCVCTAHLRNKHVSLSWSHILPKSINSDFLAFQGAPDIIINKLDALTTHKEQDDGDEEQSDDDENSQHSGRVQVGHQMSSLKPTAGSLLYEKIGELVGALHTSLACRAINKYLNGENVQSLALRAQSTQGLSHECDTGEINIARKCHVIIKWFVERKEHMLNN